MYPMDKVGGRLAAPPVTRSPVPTAPERNGLLGSLYLGRYNNRSSFAQFFCVRAKMINFCEFGGHLYMYCRYIGRISQYINGRTYTPFTRTSYMIQGVPWSAYKYEFWNICSYYCQSYGIDKCKLTYMMIWSHLISARSSGKLLRLSAQNLIKR